MSNLGSSHSCHPRGDRAAVPEPSLEDLSLGPVSRGLAGAFRKLATIGTLIGAAAFSPGEIMADERPAGPAAVRGMDEPLPRDAFFQTRSASAAPVPLNQQELTRFRNIKSWFDYVESLPAGAHDPHNGRSNLSGYWSSLRREAIAGDSSSMRILHALTLENIYKEITAPGRNLVRFNYPKFDELKAGNLGEAEFKHEVIWRGLEGLAAYYGSGLDASNELTRDIRRFYGPVMEVMRADPAHTEIQRWGMRFLSVAFPRLSPEQQNEVAKLTIDKYFNEPDGPEKMLALRTLHRQHSAAPRLEAFAGLKEKLVDALDRSAGSPEARYHIVMLTLTRADNLDRKLAGMLAGEPDPHTQRAAAWALGHLRSPSALEALIALAENDRMDARARGLAVVSIQEYRSSHPVLVERKIADYASRDRDTTPIALPAKVMLERMSGKLVSEPDYFINRFLEEGEKAEYRRLRATYVKNFDRLELLTVQKNLIDWTLLPYRDLIDKVVRSGGRLTLISGGTITDVPEHRNLIGTRTFDGRMWESVGGVSGGGHTIAPIYDLAQGSATTFSHEVMHHVHMQGFTEQQKQRVLELYRAAVRDGRAMNYYAAFNDHEYLAEGNKIFDTIYLKHEELYNQLFDDGYHIISGQIRSLLKERDPELYEFLKRLRQIQDGLARIYFRHDPFDARAREGLA